MSLYEFMSANRASQAKPVSAQCWRCTSGGHPRNEKLDNDDANDDGDNDDMRLVITAEREAGQ